MKKFRIISLIAAAVLTAGVLTVFSACGPGEDGSWMNCHHAQMTVCYIGIALVVLSLAGNFLKGRIAPVVLYAVSAVLAVIAMLVPGTLVHLCMMETMRCHSTMKPFVMLMGILIILFAVINMIVSLRQKKA